MAVAFRSANFAHSSGGVNSFNCPTPAGIAVGDVLVMLFHSWAGTPGQVPSVAGWTLQAQHTIVTSTGDNCGLFTRIADGTEGANVTVTITGTPSLVNVGILAYSGASSVAVFSDFGTSQAGAGPTVPSVTTTAANNMIVGCVLAATASSATPAAGWTERLDHNSSASSSLIYAMEIAQAAVGASATGVVALTGGTGPSWTYTLAIGPAASTTYSWDFGDSGTSTATSPSHTYTNPGVYTVSLTATNAAGSNTKTRTAYVTVNSAFVPQIIWFTPAPLTTAPAAPTFESATAYSTVANRPPAGGGGGGGIILGNNTQGAATIGAFSATFGVSKFTLASAATLNELHGWVKRSTTTVSVRLVIYKDIHGLPDDPAGATLVNYSAPLTTTSATAVDLSQAGFTDALPAGDYWVGFFTTAGDGSVLANSVAGASFSGSGGANPPPSTFPTGTGNGNVQIACWAVTGAAGPGTTRPFASSAALTGALNAASPGDLVQYTGAGILDIPGNYTGFAGRRYTGYVNIDLGLPASANHVRFTGGGGAGLPAVGIYNSTFLRIYGGEITNPPPKSVGHDGLHIYGAQNPGNGSTNHIVWWNLLVHDTVDSGIKMLPNVVSGGGNAADNTIADCDIEAEVYRIGLDKSVDFGHPELGTGQHCANLADTDPAGATYPSFLRNRVAIDGHDTGLTSSQGGGSVIEIGFNDAASTISGCTLIIRGANTMFNAQQQTGGNGLNLWGDAAINAAVPFIQHSNATGSPVCNPGGTNRPGVVVAYGRHTNTNLNAYEGVVPWQIGPTYRDVA